MRHKLLIWSLTNSFQLAPFSLHTSTRFNPSFCYIILYIENKASSGDDPARVCAQDLDLWKNMALATNITDLHTPLSSLREGGSVQQCQVYVLGGGSCTDIHKSLALAKGWQLRKCLTDIGEDSVARRLLPEQGFVKLSNASVQSSVLLSHYMYPPSSASLPGPFLEPSAQSFKKLPFIQRIYSSSNQHNTSFTLSDDDDDDEEEDSKEEEAKVWIPPKTSRHRQHSKSMMNLNIPEDDIDGSPCDSPAFKLVTFLLAYLFLFIDCSERQACAPPHVCFFEKISFNFACTVFACAVCLGEHSCYC